MSSEVKISKIGPFEFNPRGNIWFKNESTFGRKLLSKMGWSKGKGLGKNEDGIKENIKISKRDNLTGVGYSKNDVHIAVGCMEYENILSKLQKRFKNTSTECKEPSNNDLESLEQRSRNSRNHLHYQKFVRGKDLFRCSEKDMKCIFLDKPQPQESLKEELNDKETTTFSSQLNMKDYFAMKMQKKFGDVSKLNSAKELKNEISNEYCSNKPVTSKKRKRGLENAKECKQIKLECEEFLDKMSDSQNEIDSVKWGTNHLNVSEVKLSVKKVKNLRKKKTKKYKLHKKQNLKSCIKGRSSYTFNVKNVSFNDVVSYKIIDDSCEENITEINSVEAELELFLDSDIVECNEQEILTPQIISVSSHTEKEPEIITNPNSNNAVNDVISDSSTSNNCFDGNMVLNISECSNGMDGSENEESEDTACERVNDEEQVPKCFDLPKCSGPNYNFWLESQRQAMKMKMYKNMAKKMKNHQILRTTNLLDIKGYGNWGL